VHHTLTHFFGIHKPGNPNEKEYFDYMMGYCPIQNLVKRHRQQQQDRGDTITTARPSYPACFLTAGLHDPRVGYWEPAKLVAQLRCVLADRNKTSDDDDDDDVPLICLKTDMSAGHAGASDRYKYLKELAFDYAFLLDQLGLSTTLQETNGE
jgi:oligopeptidase B